MSNQFGNAFDDKDDVLEGFLCPICKEDLRSPDRLTAHFESAHSDDDQDLLTAFKEIFITAKKKIGLDDNKASTGYPSSSGILSKNIDVRQPAPIYPQSIGCDRSHFEYFRAIRTPRLERFATETNKLIIRLHKLLTDLPTDQAQRRQHEKNIVPWLDGESVKLCPSCGKRFILTRRQHHCRVCGSIMCHNCSLFLELEDAAAIVNPSFSSTAPETYESKKPENAFRTCEHCLRLLNNRKEMQDSRTYRPALSLYYEQIEKIKKDIQPDRKMYEKIVSRLYEGDVIYTLADATALHAKIARMAELIDAYSKKIMGIACPEGSRAEQLKKSIRLACIQFIKEELLSQSALPKEEEILRLQKKRKQETEQRIVRERRLALEAIERNELVGAPVRAPYSDGFASGMAVASLDNWSGSQAEPSSSSNDPLVEQINIIKGYLKQARDAMRFEEVETLQLNLQELQEEFYIRQRAKDESN